MSVLFFIVFVHPAPIYKPKGNKSVAILLYVTLSDMVTKTP